MATKQSNVVNLAPQEGKQRKAFDTEVDVMIFGGAENPVVPPLNKTSLIR